MKKPPTRFGQGTHPPSFKSIGPAIKKCATVDNDDGQVATAIAQRELKRLFEDVAKLGAFFWAILYSNCLVSTQVIIKQTVLF